MILAGSAETDSNHTTMKNPPKDGHNGLAALLKTIFLLIAFLLSLLFLKENPDLGMAFQEWKQRKRKKENSK